MKNQDKQTKKGILLAFLTSIISGIAIFYAKIAVVKIDPLVLTTSRNMTALLLLVICYWLFGKKQELKNLKRKELGQLLLIGVIGGAVPFFLFFTGLQMVGAQTANIIHKTLFIWVSILAIIFLGERFNLIYFVSYLLIVLGNFYISLPPTVSFGKGEIMILAATVLWATENILAKKVLRVVSSELVGLFRMGIGSTLLFLTTIVTGESNLFLTYDFRKLTIVFIGGTILFFYVYFWYKALKYAPASLVTLILTFSVVVGNVLNGALAGVKILPKDIYSSSFIALGTVLIFLTEFEMNRKYIPSKPRP